LESLNFTTETQRPRRNTEELVRIVAAISMIAQHLGIASGFDKYRVPLYFSVASVPLWWI